MKKKREASGTRGGDLGTTYFSYSGPSTLETGFNNPGANMDTNTDRHSRREGATLRELDSIHSSPSEQVDHDMSTFPMRSRPYRDSQSLVLIAPPYPGQAFPGYMPLAPPNVPFDPLMRTPSDLSDLRRRRNPYGNMKKMSVKHLVIFMATMFMIAFIAAIFTAVYFGHQIDRKSSS